MEADDTRMRGGAGTAVDAAGFGEVDEEAMLACLTQDVDTRRRIETLPAEHVATCVKELAAAHREKMMANGWTGGQEGRYT